MENMLKRIDRSIAALLLLGFMTSLGNAVMNVVLQPYLKHLGLSPQDVGSLQLVMSASTALALVPSAYLADMHGRKRVALASLAFSAPGFLLVVLGDGAGPLYVGFALLGLGNALASVSLNPLLADVTPPEMLDSVASLSQILGLAGGSIGMALSWLPQLAASSLGGLVNAYRLFMLAGGVVSMASFPLLLAVRSRDVKGGKSFKLAFTRNTVLLSAVNAVTALGAGASVWMINYYFMLKFGVEAGELGSRMLAETLLMIPATSLAPVVSSRMGTLHAIVLMQAASIPLLLLTAWAPSFLASATAFTARSVLMNACNPLFWSLSMRLVGEEERSRYTMLSTLAWQLAGGFGSAIGGLLMGVNPDYPLYFTAIIYTAGVLLLYGLFKGKEG